MSDIMIELTGDGGEFLIENMQPKMTSGLDNYVLITLFGGNGKDDWYTQYMNNSEKFISEFNSFITGNAKTQKNILKAEQLLKKDLEQMTTDRIADTIEVILRSISVRDIEASILIMKKNEIVYDNKYIINWEWRQ